MDRRIQVGRGALVVFGVLLVFVLVLGMLVSCASEGAGTSNAPNTTAQPEAARNVVVRVSGTQGTPYSGNYGTLVEGTQTVQSTLDATPTDYEVKLEGGAYDAVDAVFRKTQPGGGTLKVEIVVDDEVVTESKTSAEFGVTNANWFPQGETTGRSP